MFNTHVIHASVVSESIATIIEKVQGLINYFDTLLAIDNTPQDLMLTLNVQVSDTNDLNDMQYFSKYSSSYDKAIILAYATSVLNNLESNYDISKIKIVTTHIMLTANCVFIEDVAPT